MLPPRPLRRERLRHRPRHGRQGSLGVALAGEGPDSGVLRHRDWCAGRWRGGRDGHACGGGGGDRRCLLPARLSRARGLARASTSLGHARVLPRAGRGLRQLVVWLAGALQQLEAVDLVRGHVARHVGATLGVDGGGCVARLGVVLLLGRVLAGLGVVVERDADGAAVVAVVLADDLLGVQLPEPGIVVAAGRHEVGTIRTESAVPHPALVAGQSGFEGEGAGFGVGRRRLHVGDFPDLGRVVGAARGELLDVGREQDPGDVLLVGRELGQGHRLGALKGLDELPHEYVALEKSINGCGAARE